MDNDRAEIEIRSYRAVFDLERRIYRIDRVRLNPSGVPVRGLVYVALLVLAVLVAQRAPVVGWAVSALPWQCRYVALPCLGAALLTIVRIDGRPAHTALASVARYACGPRQLSAFARCPRPGACWTPPALGVIADGSGGPPWRARYRGPGAVLVRAPHRLERRGRRLALSVDAGDLRHTAGRVLRIGDRTTVDVRQHG
ncbi:MAG: hypothetical protein QOF04_2300 [Solirubrobacteraceae bacterium]|nr:hypothetical protein [Solirubrobacteraceae bacterium]